MNGKQNITTTIIAGVVAGFSIGIGFTIAQTLVKSVEARRKGAPTGGETMSSAHGCGEGCYMGARGCVCPDRMRVQQPIQHFNYEGEQPQPARQSQYAGIDFTTGAHSWGQ